MSDSVPLTGASPSGQPADYGATAGGQTPERMELEKVPLHPEPTPVSTTEQVTVVTVQPSAGTPVGPVFKDYPVWISDGKGGQVQTQIRYKNGLFMWVVVGLTCLISASFGAPCFGLIPLCIKSFKDVEHINPVDGTVVGYYNRGHEVGMK